MIYLDHAATTPVAEDVLEIMMPYFRTHFANPSSQIYPGGRTAKRAVDQSLQKMSAEIGVDESELYFTSGATQSCNWALKGVWQHYHTKRKKIMLSEIEHSAVLETARDLEKGFGAELIWIPTLENGVIDLAFVKEHLNEEVLLLCVMAVNNITGIKQPLKELGELAKQQEVFFFCDATQAMSSMHFQPKDYQIDLMAISAHKFYGPKGMGLLYAKRKNPRVNLPIWERGGGMELWKKGGTLNVPGIVGMAHALQWSHQQDWKKVKTLRDRLESHLINLGGNVLGEKEDRLVSFSNVAIPGVTGKRLLQRLQENISFSLASACSSQQVGPSHVLKAMGLDKEIMDGAFRLSWGLDNTEEDLIKTMTYFTQELKEIKK